MGGGRHDGFTIKPGPAPLLFCNYWNKRYWNGRPLSGSISGQYDVRTHSSRCETADFARTRVPYGVWMKHLTVIIIIIRIVIIIIIVVRGATLCDSTGWNPKHNANINHSGPAVEPMSKPTVEIESCSRSHGSSVFRRGVPRHIRPGPRENRLSSRP